MPALLAAWFRFRVSQAAMHQAGGWGHASCAQLARSRAAPGRPSVSRAVWGACVRPGRPWNCRQRAMLGRLRT
eukprot:276832-Rhodomonas_salina.1